GQVIAVEEKRLHIGTERVVCRLDDSIGDAVADFDPLPAQGGIRMIYVADYLNGIVVLAVAVNDNPAGARNLAENPRPRQQVAVLQLCRELEDEDSRVSGACVVRVLEGRRSARRAEEHNLVPHGLSSALVKEHVPGAAAILQNVMNKQQAHSGL